MQKEGRQRGTWDGKKADGDFYKMIVSVHPLSSPRPAAARRPGLPAVLLAEGAMCRPPPCAPLRGPPWTCGAPPFLVHRAFDVLWSSCVDLWAFL